MAEPTVPVAGMDEARAGRELGAGGGLGASNGVDALLSARHLGRHFPSGEGQLVVFEDVSLSVRKGEMVAIVGESGSGKTTLLHLLSALDTPSSGDVYFASRSLGSMDRDELAEFRNREIGFVWQFHYLLPEFTALENVMMPLMIRGDAEPAAAAAATEWMRRVGIEDRAGHRAGELSGGEQQRAAMARALVTHPSLLMADEPTGNLDERTGDRLFDLLRTLHDQHGLTSLIVTHNSRHAARCDRRLRLREGRLEEAPAA